MSGRLEVDLSDPKAAKPRRSKVSRKEDRKSKSPKKAAKATVPKTTVAVTSERTQVIERHSLTMLDQAIDALKSLDMASLHELASMPRPPATVVYVVWSLFQLLSSTPDFERINSEVNHTEMWKHGRPMIHSPDSQKRLLELDLDNIPDKSLQRARSVLENPNFDAASVPRISLALVSIHHWLQAVFNYRDVSVAS